MYAKNVIISSACIDTYIMYMYIFIGLDMIEASKITAQVNPRNI